MTLGSRIRAAREAAGLTQSAVAAKLDVSRNAVSLWESDTNSPDAAKIPKLARILNLSVEDLWIGADSDIRSEDVAIDHKAVRRNTSVTVPELDVRADMGAGAEVVSEKPVAEWGIPASILRAQTNAPMSALVVIQALGNSNEPAIPSGSRVLINTEDRTPSPPGFFAVYDGLGLVIKQVEYIMGSNPPTIRLSSANPQFQSYERHLAEVNIAGRAMGFWNWL